MGFSPGEKARVLAKLKELEMRIEGLEPPKKQEPEAPPLKPVVQPLSRKAKEAKEKMAMVKAEKANKKG